MQKQTRKLLELVSDTIQLKHYSGSLQARTKQAYADWIKRYILFYKKRYPETMNGPESVLVSNKAASESNPIALT